MIFPNPPRPAVQLRITLGLGRGVSTAQCLTLLVYMLDSYVVVYSGPATTAGLLVVYIVSRSTSAMAAAN